MRAHGVVGARVDRAPALAGTGRRGQYTRRLDAVDPRRGETRRRHGGTLRSAKYP